MNSNTAITPANPIDTIVDDAELLAILGLSQPNSPVIAVLDWDDMPELSEEEDEEDTHSETSNNKRKYNDEEEDIFAEFDFVEVNLPPQPKKQKTLLIQQAFVCEDKETIEEDIRLTMELLSPVNNTSTTTSH